LKRPPTGYFLFLQENRPKLLQEHPELDRKVAAIGKALGDQWKTLKDEEKQDYMDRAKKLKEEYDQKIKDNVRKKNNRKDKENREWNDCRVLCIRSVSDRVIIIFVCFMFVSFLCYSLSCVLLLQLRLIPLANPKSLYFQHHSSSN
jgi:hypothetical protein